MQIQNVYNVCGTVQPRLSEPQLSEPSNIQTSNQAKSAGQSTNIGYDTDMRMSSSVQCSYARVNDS